MTRTLACLLVLASCATESDPLADTHWRITAVTGVELSLLSSPPPLVFIEDSVSGSAAGNGFGGRYAIQGDQLHIAELTWTQLGCEDFREDVDKALSDLFMRPLRWQFVDGTALSLTNDAGGLLAFPMEATRP